MLPTLKRLLVGLAVFCPVTLAAQSNTVNSGATLPSLCMTGSAYITTATPKVYTCSSPNTWTEVSIGGSSSGLPSGMIAFLDAGSCPTGFAEVSGLNGKMWRGTVAANMNVGTTGGSDTATPTISWPAGVPTAANESAHTHAGGTITIGTFVNVATATTGNCAATNIAAGTGSTTACKATAPNLTVPAEGHSGSLSNGTTGAGSAHTHTISWPAGVPTNSQISTVPAYINLIACKAN